jgi:hypothetical protein
MKRTHASNSLRWTIVLVAALPLLTGVAECYPFDIPEVTCERFECTVDLHYCRATNRLTRIKVLKPTPSAGCWEWQPPAIPTSLKAGLRGNRKAYCEKDKPWVVNKITAPSLRGAGWIRPPYSAATKTGVNEGVEFRVDAEVKNVYIAYDDRAVGLPGWLADATKWTPFSDLGAWVIISKPDNFNNKKETRLKLYRSVNVPTNGQTFTVPGNQHGTPIWPTGFSASEAAMYLVIVEPNRDFNCSSPAPDTFLSKEKYAHCGEKTVTGCQNSCCTQAEVEAAAKAAALALLASGTHTTDKTSCNEVQVCPDPEEVSRVLGGLTISPYAYTRSSVIKFDPTVFKSEAEVDILDQTLTTNAEGELDFEYVLDEFDRMHTIRINGMTLHLDPLNTEAGTFSNIVVALLDPSTADCRDPLPPATTPCTLYDIPTKEFVVSVAADHADGTLVSVGRNTTGVIPVTIHHPTRSFTISGGPVRTTVNVNENEETLNISIDLTGFFENFAPQVRSDESQLVSECLDNLNSETIKLDASASFEIYGDALPTDKDSYKWYEDYKQVGEILWRLGKQETIGPNQLEYGAHEFTLVIRDSFGIADTDTFDVVVRDTVPPTLQPPPDQIRFLFCPKTAPVEVFLGTASVSDGCSDDIGVTHNAPTDRMFPEGTTTVTWTADDGRGNTASAPQDVIVVVFGCSPPMIDVRSAMAPLLQLVEEIKNVVEGCGVGSECEVSLEPAILAVDELMAGLAAAEVAEGEQVERDAIVAQLELSLTALQEAEPLLQQASQRPDEAAALRGQALSKLNEASDLLSGISSGTLAPTGPVDGDEPSVLPRCFILEALTGTPMAGEITVIREFRDEYLASNWLGERIIATYHRVSPAIVAAMDEQEQLRSLVRVGLKPIVRSIKQRSQEDGPRPGYGVAY